MSTVDTTQTTRSMIQYLQEFLGNLRFKAHFNGISDSQAFENLLIELGNSPAGHAWWVRLLYLTDVQRSLGQAVPEQLEILELYLPLGLQAETAQLPVLATLLGKLNALLPAGHFGYRAGDGVYLRQAFVLRDQDDLWPFAVSETLEVFSLHATVLEPVFQGVLAGKLDAEAAIRQAEILLGAPTEQLGWEPYWAQEA